MRARAWGVAVVVGGVLAAAGASWAWQQVLESPKFGLTEIRFVGHDRVSEDELRARVPVEMGVNLFTVELPRVEEALLRAPWVAKARVERRPPGALRIEIEEHEPRALVALGELYWVNRSRQIFAAYRVGEPIELPIILGLEREGYERGDPRTTRRLRVALDFLEAWGDGEPLPRSVEVGAGDLLRYDDSDGVSVVVGPPPFEAALMDARAARRNLELDEGGVIFVGRERRKGRVVVRATAPSDGGL